MKENPRLARFLRSILAWMAFAVFLSPSAVAQTSAGQNNSKSKAKKDAELSSSADAGFHEDWNSITLAGSNFNARPPLLASKDDIPGQPYIKELFQVQWRPYDALDLYVILPKGVTKPPVILYLYSFPQDTDRFKNNVWCTTVTSGGYAAVGFVSALTGHRVNGSRPMKEWFVSEFQESLATSTHDVQMILNFLAERGEVDMNRVGMFGQGSGGSIAILASAADPRIKALDVLTPWGDWPSWLAKSSVVPSDERAKYTTPEFLAHVAPLDPVAWISKVKAESVRIQNVRQDATMPDDSQLKIEGAAPQFAQINQYGDGGALLPKVTGGRLLDWIKAELKPDAPGNSVVTAKSERVHFYPATAKRQLPAPAAVNEHSQEAPSN